MNEKETEFRILVRTREPHRVIDRLHDCLRAIEHEVVMSEGGFVSVEMGTYIEPEEEEEE